MRNSGRKYDEIRPVQLDIEFMPNADGACLISMGNTKVSCTATIEEKVPIFLRNTNSGWVTAEYSMLPCSTNTRVTREVTKGKLSGRTQEIQRLIGRSLRAVTDLKGFGERQIILDCDVIQADGGTRTASITGCYVALFLAFKKLQKKKLITNIPLTDSVAAISCGIYNNESILDLDYIEDSNAQADANFVLTGNNKIVEIQTTAEKSPFDFEQFSTMFKLAKKGLAELTALQTKILLNNHNN